MAGWRSTPKVRATTARATQTTARQTSSVNTPIGSVSEAQHDAGHPDPLPRRSRWRWWYAVPLALVVLLLLGAAFVPLPYYAISPGSAVPTSELVQVEAGVDHPGDGEIFLMTVSLRQATALDALSGWLDRDVDVVEEDLVRPPDVSRTDLRQFNLELMAQSQQRAVAVALDELGEPYTVLGDGVVARQVFESTPAAGAIIPGEAIVALDGQPVTVNEDLFRLLTERAPGAQVVLAVENPDGSRRDVPIVLADNPNDPGRPFLGIEPATRNLQFEFPFDVEIDTNNIGGPSGGLALTLQVLDRLTEGELTGGRVVAAVGEIQLDGSVTRVGGVRQKVAAAKAAGAELFLVSSEDLALAADAAGDGLRVESADTLDEALAVLGQTGGNGVALADTGVDVVA